MAASQGGAPGSDCATCVACRLAAPDSGSAAAARRAAPAIAAGHDAAIARGSAHAAGCRARACARARGTARDRARVLALCSPPARPSGRARAREPPTPRVRRASWRDAARAPTKIGATWRTARRVGLGAPRGIRREAEGRDGGAPTRVGEPVAARTDLHAGRGAPGRAGTRHPSLCPALQCRAPAFPAQFFWMVSAVRGPRKHEKTL